MSMFDGLSGQVGGQAKMKSLADQVDLSPSSESPVPDWARRTVRMVFTAWARSHGDETPRLTRLARDPASPRSARP